MGLWSERRDIRAGARIVVGARPVAPAQGAPLLRLTACCARRLTGAVVKVADDVTMPFEHVHDLKHILIVSEEYHVALVRETSDVRAQLGARPAERPRQGGEFPALTSEAVDEPPTDSKTPAFPGSIFQNRHEVIVGGRQEDKPAHSKTRLGQLRCFCLQRGPEFVIGDASASRNRGIQRLAKRLQPGFAFLDQAEPFAHDLARRPVAAAFHRALDETFPPLAYGHIHRTTLRCLSQPG